jgi:hypothetical protein
MELNGENAQQSSTAAIAVGRYKVIGTMKPETPSGGTLKLTHEFRRTVRTSMMKPAVPSLMRPVRVKLALWPANMACFFFI